MQYLRRQLRGRNLAGLLCLALLLFMFFRWFEYHQVYHPMSRFDANPAQAGLAHEEVWIGQSPRIHGWFFPARSDSPRRQIAVLVSHGNGGNISHRLDLAESLLQTGVAVFLFDYRGYGRSTGKPGEEGTYQDGIAAYRWLLQKGFAAENIIAYGESLGGGIAAEVAMREKLGGLILQSTFTCITDVGAELLPWLPVRLLCSIHYDTLGKLPRIRIPVLVMHSRNDTLIRFQHAERNFTAANEPKLLIELIGDHNDGWAGEKSFVPGIEKFLLLIENNPARK